MNNVLSFIAQLVQLANLALEVYADVKPFLDKINAAATTPNWQPTDQDWADLDALEAPLRAALQAQESST